MDNNQLAENKRWENHLRNKYPEIDKEFRLGLADCKYNSQISVYGSIYVEKYCKGDETETEWKKSPWIEKRYVYMGDYNTIWKFDVKVLCEWLDNQKLQTLKTARGKRLFLSDADEIGTRI